MRSIANVASTWACALCLTLCQLAPPSLAQTSSDLNAGLQVTQTAADLYTMSWWGVSGTAYFIQTSLDLITWHYIPLVEGGADAVNEWAFQSDAERMFIRLRYVPNYDPAQASTTDSDGDGVPDLDELDAGTDPFDADSLPPARLEFVSGADQHAVVGGVASAPLKVRVLRANTPVAGVPVTFQAVGTLSGAVSVTGTGPWASSSLLPSGSNGLTEVYWQAPGVPGACVIAAQLADGSGQSVQFVLSALSNGPSGGSGGSASGGGGGDWTTPTQVTWTLNQRDSWAEADNDTQDPAAMPGLLATAVAKATQDLSVADPTTHTTTLPGGEWHRFVPYSPFQTLFTPQIEHLPIAQAMVTWNGERIMNLYWQSLQLEVSSDGTMPPRLHLLAVRISADSSTLEPPEVLGLITLLQPSGNGAAELEEPLDTSLTAAGITFESGQLRLRPPHTSISPANGHFKSAGLFLMPVHFERDLDVADEDWDRMHACLAEALPGERLNLRLNGSQLPDGVVISDFSWELPDKTFADYQANIQTATVTPVTAADTVYTEVGFYFADGGGKTLTVSCTANGVPLQFKTTLNLLKPYYDLSTRVGEVQIALGETALQCGSGGDSPLGGISFTGTVEVPNHFAPGQWQFVQLVSPMRSRKLLLGPVQNFSLNGTTVLDNTYPYSGPYMTEEVETDVDSPSSPLTLELEEVTVGGDQFAMTLMFRPAGEASKYVPLAKARWHWQGIALRDGASWFLGGTPTPEVKVDGVTEESDHPTWTDNVQNGGF